MLASLIEKKEVRHRWMIVCFSSLEAKKKMMRNYKILVGKQIWFDIDLTSAQTKLKKIKIHQDERHICQMLHHIYE